MSVSREVLASVCEVPEEEVRCATCRHRVLFINDAYHCKLWKTNTILRENDFCSFWDKDEVDDTYCTDETCETFLRDLNCERCTK